MNTIAYFEIQSSNLERDATFYRTVFGWNITKDDAMPIKYYRIAADGMQGALLERPADVERDKCFYLFNRGCQF
jgi:predicted enzyme related to lactoylglutathione lyase